MVDTGSVATLARAATPIGPDLSWVQGKRFPVIGAYDGDDVGIGRVVVDSTWHHWFSYNLHGFREENPSVYEGMQVYYRNVGLWLTTLPAWAEPNWTSFSWKGCAVSRSR